jgi:putative FmdB family regulatory protein
MPTYDYVCDACKHQFEEFQSMSEAPLKTCPQCKKKKLRRLIGTGAAILFKGPGFYQTDYRSESYKSAAKAADKVDTNGTTAAAKPADSGGAAATDAGSNGKPTEKKAKSGG